MRTDRGEKRVADYVLTHSKSIAGMRTCDWPGSGVAGSRSSALQGAGLHRVFGIQVQLLRGDRQHGGAVHAAVIKRGDGMNEIFNKVFTCNITPCTRRSSTWT